jgi:uncharacterized spore protein YtfJ
MEKLESVQLFHVQHDPSERFDLAEKHPEIIQEIEHLVSEHKKGMVPIKSNLEKRISQK